MNRGFVLRSGRWTGSYTQFRRSHGQVMTLEFADGIIRGRGEDGLGAFQIEGEFRAGDDGASLGWIKTYNGAHSVLYLGTLEGSVIKGNWEVAGLNDRFEIRFDSARASCDQE